MQPDMDDHQYLTQKCLASLTTTSGLAKVENRSCLKPMGTRLHGFELGQMLLQQIMDILEQADHLSTCEDRPAFE